MNLAAVTDQQGRGLQAAQLPAALVGALQGVCAGGQWPVAHTSSRSWAEELGISQCCGAGFVEARVLLV